MFFLIDWLGFKQTTVGWVTFYVFVVSTIGIVLIVVVFGFFFDWFWWRKIFVLMSVIVLVVAHIIVLFVGIFSMFLIVLVIVGIAMGCYIVVDMVLIVEVFLDCARVGKDMGVLYLANVLPQTIASALVPVFLLIGSAKDNYLSLFIGGATIGIIGVVVNQFIKSLC